jgi:hypothetical protein
MLMEESARLSMHSKLLNHLVKPQLLLEEVIVLLSAQKRKYPTHLLCQILSLTSSTSLMISDVSLLET